MAIRGERFAEDSQQRDEWHAQRQKRLQPPHALERLGAERSKREREVEQREQLRAVREIYSSYVSSPEACTVTLDEDVPSLAQYEEQVQDLQQSLTKVLSISDLLIAKTRKLSFFEQGMRKIGRAHV